MAPLSTKLLMLTTSQTLETTAFNAMQRKPQRKIQRKTQKYAAEAAQEKEEENEEAYAEEEEADYR